MPPTHQSTLSSYAQKGEAIIRSNFNMSHKPEELLSLTCMLSEFKSRDIPREVSE